MTSHDVVDAVRRLIGQRRVGHAGTLDPLATGVLVVCVGKATRLVEFMVGHDKVYRVTVRLGVETDTYDAEGQAVAEHPVPPLTRGEIVQVLTRFQGHLEQVPPRYAAVRHKGKRLYEWAREGVEVRVKPRQVRVYALELEDWRPPDLTLRVTCSAGTYIRSLAHDIGQAMGTGGYVRALRRLASGPFRAEEAVPLDALFEAPDWRGFLQPVDAGLVNIPVLDLTETQVEAVRQGRPLHGLPPGDKKGVWRRGYAEGQLVVMLQWDAGRYVWWPRKVLLA